MGDYSLNTFKKWLQKNNMKTGIPYKEGAINNALGLINEFEDSMKNKPRYSVNEEYQLLGIMDNKIGTFIVTYNQELGNLSPIDFKKEAQKYAEYLNKKEE